MDALGTVYGLTFDGPLRYVGQTRTSARMRLGGHRQAAREGVRQDVYDWMREIGPGLVRAVVLERVPVDQLNAAEKDWIAQLRAQGAPLLNMTGGGAGNSGWRHRPETIERLRVLNRREFTPQHRAAMSAARVGRAHSRRHQFADIATQVDGGTLGAHRRWHEARNRTSDTCALCAA